jgi:hypothetical protein
MGLATYYFIDKYNLSTRRTLKQSLGKDLALVMNDMLELCVLYMCLGDIVFRYLTQGSANWIDWVCLIIAVCYTPIPKARLNELLFPLFNEDESVPYDVAVLDFDTDYDRENPITRKAAL